MGTTSAEILQKDMYSSDSAIKETAFARMAKSLEDNGFVAEIGKTSETQRISELRDTGLSLWRRLIDSGWGVVGKYMNLGTFGQAEIVDYEDSVGSFGELSADIRPYELKVFLHVRKRFDPDNPLLQYRKWNFLSPNIDIDTPGLEDFIPTVEAQAEEMEGHNVHTYRGLEKHLGYPDGLWSSLLVDGDSTIRYIHYFGLDTGEILNDPVHDNMQCLTVRFKYDRIMDDVLKNVLYRLRDRLRETPDPTNFELDDESITIKYLTRAWWHMDSDVDASLADATTKGLKFKDRRGEIVPVTTTQRSLIRNGGSYLDHLSATMREGEVYVRFKGLLHGVDCEPETPGDYESLMRNPRSTAVGFNHIVVGGPLLAADRDPRIQLEFPDTIQAYELYKTLCDTGLIGPKFAAAALRGVITMSSALPFADMAKMRLAHNGGGNLAEFSDWLHSPECDFYRAIQREGN
jgi:hypothetical protein